MIVSPRNNTEEVKSDKQRAMMSDAQKSKEVTHIPCLLIQKKVKFKARKREHSVVNLLRSHMKDLAKSYQLHQ